MHTDWKTTREFLNYLRGVLVPDLRTSGRDATAEDFEDAAEFIERAEQRRAQAVRDPLSARFCFVCGEQLKPRWPGGDPENGPRMMMCSQPEHPAFDEVVDGAKGQGSAEALAMVVEEVEKHLDTVADGSKGAAQHDTLRALRKAVIERVAEVPEGLYDASEDWAGHEGE